MDESARSWCVLTATCPWSGFTRVYKPNHVWPLLVRPDRTSMAEEHQLGLCPFCPSQEWWYSSCEPTENLWPLTLQSLPSWHAVVSGNVSTQEIQKNKFLMRVNILDNPF